MEYPQETTGSDIKVFEEVTFKLEQNDKKNPGMWTSGQDSGQVSKRKGHW